MYVYPDAFAPVDPVSLPSSEVAQITAPIDPSASVDSDKSWQSIRDAVSYFDIFALIARTLGK